MVTLNIRLPDNLDQQLTALAFETHQKRSDLTRTPLEKTAGTGTRTHDGGEWFASRDTLSQTFAAILLCHAGANARTGSQPF